MGALVNPSLFTVVGGAAPTFIGSSMTTAASTSPVSFPVGSAAGDIGMFLSCGTGINESLSFPASTWTTGVTGTFGSVPSNRLNMIHGRKILTSTDVANPLNGFTHDQSVLLVVYRGGSSIANKVNKIANTIDTNFDGDPDAEQAVTSWSTSVTKSPGSLILINLLLSRDNLVTISVSPWNVNTGSSFYKTSDITPTSYTDGSSITSSWTTSSYKLAQSIFEIT